MHAVPVFVAVIISYAAAQQTFQSTVFDLPAELPAEDYALLSQIDDVPKKEIKQITKPKKIDKGALHPPQVEPPTQPSPFAQPRSVSQPSNHITPVPFSLATYPTLPSAAPPMHFTIAPLSLPVNFTPPPSPFVLPTHPTLSPIILPSHPTLPPFTFPTHPTLPPLTAAPPSQLPITGTAQFPQFQQIGSQPHVVQPPQQFQQYGSQPQAIQSPQHFQQFGSQPQAIQSPQQFQQFGSQPQAIQTTQQFQQFGSQPQAIPSPQQFQQFGSVHLQPPQQPHQENPSLVYSPENYQQRNDAQIPFFQTQTEQPLHYQPAQAQSQVQQSILQTKEQGRNAEQPQVLYGGFPPQGHPPVYSQFPQLQQLVAQTAPQQPQQLRPLQQQYGERNYEQPNHLIRHPQSFGPTQSQTQHFVQPATPQFIGFQPNQRQQHYEQAVASGQTLLAVPQPRTFMQQNTVDAQNSGKQSGQVERVSNSTPNRFSMWFKEDFDTSGCEKNLSVIAEKFRAKFPLYLQKGAKDDALADLVGRRLIECDRKSRTNHWDKVDGLLTKVSLSKSEESECRSGLVQERISCVNLLHYACQFVNPSFTFRLVPARITVEEARQAESGAEKCRKVVRLVKKRLEG